MQTQRILSPGKAPQIHLSSFCLPLQSISRAKANEREKNARAIIAERTMVQMRCAIYGGRNTDQRAEHMKKNDFVF
jgi:hypothetical protein